MPGRSFKDFRGPGMSYHTATDEVMSKHGGQGPPCPHCGEPMFPIDDHGRFACSCKMFKSIEGLFK